MSEELTCPDCGSTNIEKFFDGEGMTNRCRDCDQEWFNQGE